MEKNIGILVIDRDPFVRDKIRTTLYRTGYNQVEEAWNIRMMNNSINENRYNLVIVGNQMPHELGSYEICRQIRKTPNGKNITIIGIQSNDNSIDEWIEAGADYVINKEEFSNRTDYQTSDLDAKIQEALKKYQ